MPILAQCSCGKSFQARDDLAGKRVRCPACGGVIAVPQAAAVGNDPLGLGGFDPGAGAPVAAQLASGPLYGNAPAKPTASGGSNLVVWICVGVGGGVMLLLLMGMVVAMMIGGSRTKTVDSSSAPTTSSPPAPAAPRAASSTGRVAPAAASSAAAQPPAAPGGAVSAPPSPGSASAGQPADKWTAIADPPARAVAWPEKLDVNVPIPPEGASILYPATPGAYVCVGLNVIGKPGVEVWNLLEGAKAGQLTGPVNSSNYALAPDGAHLAAVPSGFEGYGKVEVHSLKSGGLVKVINYGSDKHHVQFFAFTAPDKLLIHSQGTGSGGFERQFSLWSIPDGRLIRKFDVDTSFQATRLVVSPGGRYVAALKSNDKLTMFDLDKGRPAGSQQVKQLFGGGSSAYRGMSFSPDGQQLAIVYSSTNSQIAFLDMATGGLAQVVDFAGKPPTASAYKGDAVEWLGDFGWCLFGGTVIDRNSHKVVWNLDLPITTRLSPRRTLPGGWIAEGGGYREKSLRFVPLPVGEIQASLAALDDGSALLHPGAAVSLDIQIGQLRHGEAQDTQKRLAEIFQERFAGDGIEVADGQPLVLKVNYSEGAGRTLQERQGIAGPATGRTVQATKIIIQMTLASRDGSQSFFTREIEHDPFGVTIIGKKQVDESTVRDSIFRQLLFKLSETPIPYFIPEQSGMSQLPGVTKVQ